MGLYWQWVCKNDLRSHVHWERGKQVGQREELARCHLSSYLASSTSKAGYRRSSELPKRVPHSPTVSLLSHPMGLSRKEVDLRFCVSLQLGVRTTG